MGGLNGGAVASGEFAAVLDEDELPESCGRVTG